MKRRQSAPHTFEENIAAEKARLEAQIVKLKPGPQMDALLRKIRQLDTAVHMSEWLSSPASASQLSGYRAYIIGADGHIQLRVDLLCDNDETAKEQGGNFNRRPAYPKIGLA